MAASLSPHLASLAALCARVPAHRTKTLFVPKKQVGRTLTMALAAGGISWLNLSTATVLQHAQARAAKRVQQEGWRSMAAGLDVLIVDTLLRSDPDSARHIAKSPAPSVARALLNTFQTLRQAAVSPEVFAAAAGASDRGRATANLYAAYVAYLTRNRLLDEAQVYQLAMETPRPAFAPPCVYAILDEVELSELALRYVRLLATEAEGCYRISHAGQASPPPRTAGCRLAGDAAWQVLEAQTAPATENIHFCESIGAENEVRAVLRHVLERRLPLDQVEVVYTANDPYLTLFYSLGRRYDLPVTLAAGVPARSTRTGQALRGFYTWIENGLDAAVLIRLLRGGLIRTDRLPGAPAPHVVATMLAEAGAGRGRATYADVLGLLARNTRSEQRKREIEAAGVVLARLLRLVPEEREVSLRHLLASSLGFLHLFGPIDVSPHKAPSAYSPDEHVFVLIRQRLLELEAAPETTGPPVLLAGRLRELVENLFAGARAPQPGHLHVVPLSSAGYAGRPHVFVVGMDEASFTTAMTEDPLLLDDERAALNTRTGTSLVLAREETGGSAYHFERARAGASGSLTLVANRFDLAADRELSYSAAYLQLLHDVRPERIVSHTFAPSPEPNVRKRQHAWHLSEVTLDDAEVWLAVRRDQAVATEAWLRERYPQAWRGREADRLRASSVFTPHDGWLGEALDGPGVLAGRLSASRLEALTTCPFRYFLKYILRVVPLQEREREEEVCLDRIEQGKVLHDVFMAFMLECKQRGERPQEVHRPRLHQLLRERLEDRYGARFRAHPAAGRKLTRQLHKAADVFLTAEIAHARDHEPFAIEQGFGLVEGRTMHPHDHTGELVVTLGPDLTLQLTGWVDRVDRRDADGKLAVWDYKTGSMSPYKKKDLLQAGRHLQWALYSFALEQLYAEQGLRVHSAGYFFTSARGAGQRLADDPHRYRDEIADLLRRFAAMADDGCFPQAPSDDNCKYCDFARICGPYEERAKEIKAKLGDSAIGHPCEEHLRAWNYA